MKLILKMNLFHDAILQAVYNHVDVIFDFYIIEYST